MGLLTVVTVVRNDPTGLDRTLQSIAAGSVAPDEVIVVDGSDDPAQSRAITDAHPRLPVVLVHQPPAGVYPAMNAGIERARGDYLHFLNAGDILADPEVLASVCPLLAEQRPLWAFGLVRFVSEDGTALAEPAWSYAEEWRHHLARGRFPAHQGVFAQTSALRALGGFDLRYRVAADYASVLQLARQSAPLELGVVIAEFTTGGLSTQRWGVALGEFHRARREILGLTGAAAVRERLWDARIRLATIAYRSLWAPGRPAHRLIGRLRRTQ